MKIIVITQRHPFFDLVKCVNYVSNIYARKRIVAACNEVHMHIGTDAQRPKNYRRLRGGECMARVTHTTIEFQFTQTYERASCKL